MNKTELIQKIQSLDALTNDEKAGLRGVFLYL